MPSAVASEMSQAISAGAAPMAFAFENGSKASSSSRFNARRTKSKPGLVYCTAGSAPLTNSARVMAQRAAGECLVAEDRPVLDVHHRLQCHLRGKDRPVS